MKEDFKTDRRDTASRLLAGEKVICPKCQKGFFETSCKDTSKAHCFVCGHCEMLYNLDPSNVIVE